jgi:hypothetical protein
VNGREDKFLSYGCQNGHPQNCITTTGPDIQPWWVVDMEKSYTLTHVHIMGRQRLYDARDGELYLYNISLPFYSFSLGKKC